ncbi:DUF2029 domain-containing protein [Candidatus Marsarchaeota archaeon]|jgi:hypothetical protein|nr:DUF2029 domain-containing protein [Candidatus Marsarchaeota archaeon]
MDKKYKKNMITTLIIRKNNRESNGVLKELQQKIKPKIIFVYALIITLYAFALFDALHMYSLGGADWDFIAHWLWAKSLTNYNFYSALFSGHLANAILYSNTFYFETLRAPLAGIIMIPFTLLDAGLAMPLYFAFILALLLYSVIYASKAISINPLVLSLLLFTPYVALFLMLLNGTEIVSVILLIILVAMLISKDWKAGIVLALAGLAKYPNLIFVPLLLFLPKEKQLKAFALFLIVTGPWIAFNTIVYHNPVLSYIISIGSFSNGGASSYFPINIISQSLLLILPELVPALLVLVIGLFLMYKKRNGLKAQIKVLGRKMISWNDRRYKIIISFLALGFFGFLVTSLRGSINDLPRLGYLIYTGIALFLAISLSDLANKFPSRKNVYLYLLTGLFVISIIILLTWFPYTGYVFYGSSSPALGAVGSAMVSQGISHCNVISNNWVYLIYLGYKAHFPYYYNYTVQHYPVVFFTNTGSNQSSINFANVSLRINYSDFFIAFPRNYSC